MKPIMKRYKQERHNSNNYNEMIKKITNIGLVIFLCIDAFLFYKAVISYKKIDTFEKKTAWVKSFRYHSYRNSKELEIVLGREKEVKELKEMAYLKNNPDIKIAVHRWLSIKKLPQIEFKDEITYYLMKDSFFSEPKIIGVSRSKEPMSNLQLFLDIYQYYVNTIFWIPFIVTAVLYLLMKKFFKKECEEYHFGKMLIYKVIFIHIF